MFKGVFSIILHAVSFILLVFYYIKSFSFFKLFQGIVKNKLLHLFHTSLIIHIMIFIRNIISQILFGTLFESEREFYNNKIYMMFSDSLFVISFFVNDFKMVNVLYFVFLFNFNSILWVYTIKVKNNSSGYMLIKGLLGFISALLLIYFCHMALLRQFSIVALFGLEYILGALKYLKLMAIIIFDMIELKIHKTLWLFYISIIYCVLESCTLFSFICYVTIYKKFSLNFARLLFVSLLKLRKKIKLLFTYLNLCRYLDTLADVNVESTCVICTEIIVTGKLLPCNHSFHTDCLKMWYEHESNCPVCRADLNITKEKQIMTENEIIYGVPIDV